MTATERQAAFAKVSASVMKVIRAEVADLKVEVNPTGPTGLSLYADGEVRELEALRAFVAKHLSGKIDFLYHYPADEDMGAADTYTIA
jgi:hypothetical protein